MTKTLLMAERTPVRGESDAEPVEIEAEGEAVTLRLDDGEALTLARLDLLRALAP